MAGVYAIFDDTTGIILYIGSSYKSILNRVQNHRWQLENNKHKNRELQQRYNNGNHLRFASLIEFDGDINISKAFLLETERRLIHAFETPVNINYKSIVNLQKSKSLIGTS
jgi:hypothetical protein